jgi:hypothetical protein
MFENQNMFQLSDIDVIVNISTTIIKGWTCMSTTMFFFGQNFVKVQHEKIWFPFIRRIFHGKNGPKFSDSFLKKFSKSPFFKRNGKIKYYDFFSIFILVCSKILWMIATSTTLQNWKKKYLGPKWTSFDNHDIFKNGK